MFESRTYEALLADVLARAPEGIDTRQGSVFFDAVSGPIMKIAKLYTDLDLVFLLVSLDTATGEYLDLKAGEHGIRRIAATRAQYLVTFEGASPIPGERFFYDGLYFTLRDGGDEIGLILEAEEPGTGSNDIVAGTPAIPVNSIEGLTSATFGTVITYGENDETDDSLRKRAKEKINGPAENGNKQHYKTWCESIDGVGIARILPLWNGPNTVKAVLISPEATACGSATVDAVQEYVDPATLGYTAKVGGVTYVVGDGLGEGVANIGAHFTAVSARELQINVTATVELQAEADIAAVTQEVKTALKAYLKDMVIRAEKALYVVVRISAIGAALSAVENIVDYQNLLVNGGTANITPGEDYIPVLGEVTLNVAL